MDLVNDSKSKKTNCQCKIAKVQQAKKEPPGERCKALVPAVPPVLKNVGKLAAGVAGMASGSATVNQNNIIQETNYVCFKNGKTNKMDTMDLCSKIKCYKTDVFTNKSPNQYSKVASNDINFNTVRDDSLISKDDIVYTSTTTKKEIPFTSNNLDSLKAPQMLIESKEFRDLEADKFESNNTDNKYVDLNITELFQSSNNLTNLQVNSTKHLPLVSNNIDLFDTSNKNTSNVTDFKNLHKFETDISENNFLLFSNNVDLFAKSDVSANMTKSATTNSNNIDLFRMTSEQENTITSVIKKRDENVGTSKQTPIDLFDNHYIGNNIDNNEDVMYIKDANGYISTSNTETDKYDLPDLPEIERDEIQDQFYLRMSYLDFNNCECKILVKKNKKKSRANEKTCKIYTTNLEMKICSHVGNPRNKTALQPGHSLMDWIRLSHSGQDLTGVGPRAGTLSVSPRQLAEHNTEDDAWIAIRGKVYNITAYFDFHPGGKEELMKGAGQDATQMFNAVHPWVNYESILQKCLVGRLTTVEVLDEDMYSLFYGRSNQTMRVPDNFRVNSSSSRTSLNGELSTEITEKLASNSNDEMSTETMIKLITNVEEEQPAKSTDSSTEIQIGEIKTLTQSSIVSHEIETMNTSATNSNSELPAPVAVITNPKFDWMQEYDYITTIFYTKPFCNPQLQITSPTKDNKLDIIIIYNNYIFKNHIHFSDNIHWPCKVILTSGTGKIEINFRKIVPDTWDNFGTLIQEHELITESYQYERIKYVILNNIKENHNTHLIAFQRIDGVKQTIPIGYHLKVYAKIHDQDLVRCYTPLPCSFMRKYSLDYEAYRGDVCLLIKSYPEGLLSPTICDSKKGDTFEFSPPIGSFNIERVANKNGYLFLAAGSGITPMLAIIKFILENTEIQCEKLFLLYFNRSEEDIILRSHFDTLVKSDKRVVVKYVLSHPSHKWTGISGHIDEALLRKSIDEQCTNTHLFPADIFSLICGPLVFTNLAKSILTDIGYTDDNMHVFGS